MKKIPTLLTILSWVIGMSLVFAGQFGIGVMLWLIIFLPAIFLKKSLNWTDFAAIIIFSFIGVSVFIFKDTRFYPYTGTLVYSVLFCTTLLSILTGKVTLVGMEHNESKISSKKIRRDWFWLILFLACNIISLVLIPNSLYIFLPLMLLIAGMLIDFLILKRVKV